MDEAAAAALRQFLPHHAQLVFDAVPDAVFFVKDAAGRYLLVNDTLVARLGFRHKDEVLGRTTVDVFPRELGRVFYEQDRAVLDGGRALRDRLELHLRPTGAQGWCLTSKFPLHARDGATVGMVGVSKDLRAPAREHASFARLSDAVAHLEAHYDRPLRIGDLARRAGLSPARFRRLFERVYGLPPRRYLQKVRLDAAMGRLTRGDESIAAVAHACGYADHSAFTRQFRARVGLSPSAYRRARTPAPVR